MVGMLAKRQFTLHQQAFSGYRVDPCTGRDITDAQQTSLEQILHRSSFRKLVELKSIVTS
jgi:hypothetical protein